jgi:hypothetical protein
MERYIVPCQKVPPISEELLSCPLASPFVPSLKLVFLVRAHYIIVGVKFNVKIC